MPTKKIRLSLDNLTSEDPRQLLRIFEAPPDTPASPVVELAIPVGGFDIPDLSGFPAAHQKAAHLLRLAAGIEHALMVQYLYSAYSIGASSGTLANVRKSIAGIAVEEMAHLMTVENILLLIGLEPSVRRADRQNLTVDPVVPFDLRFEKFSKTALAKYIVAEAPAHAEQFESLFPKIAEIAGSAHMAMIKQVGLLYALLGVVFGNEAVLNELGGEASPDPWYKTVKALADEIAANPIASMSYGGRTGMHLADADFQSGAGNPFLARQSDDSMWDRSTRQMQVRIHLTTDRRTALAALRDISIQGEAPSSTAMDPASHFRRFVDAFKLAYGDDGQGQEPASGIHAVPAGAAIEIAFADGGEHFISNTLARPWARLAEMRYQIMLSALDHYLHSPPDDREFLIAWCFGEMFHLKMLGGFLAVRPQKADGSGNAAIPFNLPEHLPSEVPVNPADVNGPRTPWPALLSGLFDEAIQISTGLLPSITDPREQQILRHMIETDPRKAAEAAARRSGNTTRTTFDRVRETLDWAAGAGMPGHSNQGRFWNLPVETLRDTVVFGQKVIDTPAEDSAMVAQLQQGLMPRNRSKLNTAQLQPKIDEVLSWIQGGTPTDQPVAAAARQLEEIRILPPLAIARMGSAEEPMHNYNVLPPASPSAYPQMVPAETLVVDPQNGHVIRAVTPLAMSFRDAIGRIKPVSPFLELWGRFSGEAAFEPLTLASLASLGLQPRDVRWTVEAANLKMFRRTGHPNDRVVAHLEPQQLENHQRTEIVGRCNHFRPNTSVSFGFIQYVRPTSEFPDIRIRFTPAQGLVFGHTTTNVIPTERAIYNAAVGDWDGHSDANIPANSATPRARSSTVPGGIYAQTPPPRVNRGYFDDACDGLVRVTIAAGDKTLSAVARISSGPPDFAPQHAPIRSVQDDLEQMALGPVVDSVDAAQVISIVRRAVETIRLVSTENENESFPFWVASAQTPFGSGGARYFPTRGLHEGILAAVMGLESADVQQRATAVAALRQLVAVLRPSTETWNYSSQAAAGARPPIQQMPALMRGGDGGLLTLTERQINILTRAIAQFDTGDADTTALGAMRRLISSHQFAATLHSGVGLPQGGALGDLFADPDTLMGYLSNPATVARSGFAASLGISGQRMVVPQNTGGSALVTLVSQAGHPMNEALSSYTDALLNIDGIQVIKMWINSLPTQ